ncbi:MAG: hypothetical protein GXY58_12900 [Planctomycetaceae bacterium]|nr:hypothetical protein [Planctomycetaceae bacterium]
MVLEPEQLRAEIVAEFNALRLAHETGGDPTEDRDNRNALVSSVATKETTSERHRHRTTH